MTLTTAEIENVLSAWDDADIAIIKRIIYFDGWQTYEECGGIMVFEGIDDSIQIASYGKCVMADGPEPFCPLEISKDEADAQIEEMTEQLTTHDWPAY